MAYDLVKAYTNIVNIINKLALLEPFDELPKQVFIDAISEINFPNKIHGIKFIHDLVLENETEGFSPTAFNSDFEAISFTLSNGKSKHCSLKKREELFENLSDFDDDIFKLPTPRLTLVFENATTDGVKFLKMNKEDRPGNTNPNYIQHKKKQKSEIDGKYYYADTIKSQPSFIINDIPLKVKRPSSITYKTLPSLKMISEPKLFKPIYDLLYSLSHDELKLMEPSHFHRALKYYWTQIDEAKKWETIWAFQEIQYVNTVYYPWSFKKLFYENDYEHEVISSEFGTTAFYNNYHWKRMIEITN